MSRSQCSGIGTWFVNIIGQGMRGFNYVAVPFPPALGRIVKVVIFRVNSRLAQGRRIKPGAYFLRMRMRSEFDVTTLPSH